MIRAVDVGRFDLGSTHAHARSVRHRTTVRPATRMIYAY